MIEPFESELRQFSPNPPTPELQDNIAAALQRTREPTTPRPFGDRLLLATMSMGLAAAVAIASMLSIDFFGADSHRPSPSSLANTPSAAPSLMETRDLLYQFALRNDAFDHLQAQ